MNIFLHLVLCHICVLGQMMIQALAQARPAKDSAKGKIPSGAQGGYK